MSKQLDDKDIIDIENQEDKGKKGEKGNSFLTTLWDWGKSFIIALVIALLIKAVIFEPTQVLGQSMENTLFTGDRVIVNKLTLRFNPIKRKDIIVMHYKPTKEDYIKRVIGLPGETVQLIDGSFYINGDKIEENYIKGDRTEANNGFEWKLGQDEYFVAGDNRLPGKSKDSRAFGPVKLDDILGVASFRFYPLGDSFGKLK